MFIADKDLIEMDFSEIERRVATAIWQEKWRRSSDFVVRHIPFYEGKVVQKVIGGGRLRGRGSRRFKHPMSPVHKNLGPGRYKMHPCQLDHSLPHHLSTEFTLYNTRGSNNKVYTDFVCIRKDGKLVIRLQV